MIYGVVKKHASALERSINAWAADIVLHPPLPLSQIRRATLLDVFEGYSSGQNAYAYEPTPIQVQGILRHALAQTIAESIINCLVITDSAETNIQLTRIHEHIFSRNSSLHVHMNAALY